MTYFDYSYILIKNLIILFENNFLSVFMKNNKVDAGPTREFIINTITKDIRIEAAIFDLIDNSINAAESIAKQKRLEKYFVSLKINNLRFEVTDNCGGIPEKKVLGDALKIGSSLDYEGGHGIGLKRAFLKFGKTIRINSNRSDYSCNVLIDVNKWGKRNNWGIGVEKIEYNENQYQGFVINICNLYNEIVRKLSDNKFIQNLIGEIAVRYRYKLQYGFMIIVNGQQVKPLFIQGDKIAESSYKVINGINTKIILYNNVAAKENGWDIVINGRVIFQRDKTERTLWRKKLIRPGCSYERFVGEVLIESDNIKKLPIWSTKDGIDINSKAYEDILDYMYFFINKHRTEFKKSEIYIQYSRPSNLVESLKEYFNVKTAKEVGEMSFDNTYNNKIKK